MAEEQDVQPTVEPTIEEPVTPEEPQNSVESVLDTLKNLGIDSPQALEGMHGASQQAGNLANQLGDSRREVQMLREEMMQIRAAQQNQPKAQPEQYYDSYDANNDQNIINAVEQTVSRVFDKKVEAMGKQQVEANQRFIAEEQAIQGDKDFNIVRDVWEAKLKDPKFMYGLQTGQINKIAEYNDTVKTFYRELLVKSRDTLEGLTKKAKPPHIESNSTYSTSLPETSNEMTDKIKGLKKDWRGSDDDVLKMVKAFTQPQ